MKLQHLVVTRLTMKLFYEGFSREWLEERLRLFRTYCVPGMAAQTIDDYQWLILCDEDTDPDFVEQHRGDTLAAAPAPRRVHLKGARSAHSGRRQALYRGGHRVAHHHPLGRR